MRFDKGVGNVSSCKSLVRFHNFDVAGELGNLRNRYSGSTYCRDDRGVFQDSRKYHGVC